MNCLIFCFPAYVIDLDISNKDPPGLEASFLNIDIGKCNFGNGSYRPFYPANSGILALLSSFVWDLLALEFFLSVPGILSAVCSE